MSGAAPIWTLLRSCIAVSHSTGLFGFRTTASDVRTLSSSAAALQPLSAPAFADATAAVTPKRDTVFVDRLRVRAVGGHGGTGAVSIWGSRAKGKHQPADGGSGGPGGSVVLRASQAVRSLAHVQRHLAAGRGGRGGAQRKRGAAGADCVVDVPLGTVVYRAELQPRHDAASAALNGSGTEAGEQPQAAPQAAVAPAAPFGLRFDAGTGGGCSTSSGAGIQTSDGADAAAAIPVSGGAAAPQGAGAAAAPAAGASRDPEAAVTCAASTAASGSAVAEPGAASRPPVSVERLPVVADLVADGETVVVAAGGAGGRGNAAFRAAHNRPASRRHEVGQPGKMAALVLEMKLLADVGLVGFPNAGKSTLLRGISRATPQVASYPFTTLRPQLGTVVYSDGGTLTVADIPGLIEGAHANRGLGHAFLRHIQRTHALVFVVDVSGRLFGDAVAPLPPQAQLALLRRELELYDPSLLRIPALVVANKTDMLAPPQPSSDSNMRVDVPAGVQQLVEELRSSTDLPVLPASGLERQGLADVCEALRQYARL